MPLRCDYRQFRPRKPTEPSRRGRSALIAALLQAAQLLARGAVRIAALEAGRKRDHARPRAVQPHRLLTSYSLFAKSDGWPGPSSMRTSIGLFTTRIAAVYLQRPFELMAACQVRCTQPTPQQCLQRAPAAAA